MDFISFIVHGIVPLVAIVIVSMLLNNKHVDNWARKNKYLKKDFEDTDTEAEAAERLQNNALNKHDCDQSFEIEPHMSYGARLFLSAFFSIPAIILLWWLHIFGPAGFRGGTPASNLIIILIVSGSFLALVVWGLYSAIFIIPKSLKVTHQTVYIRRLWPATSQVIHLGHIHRIHIERGHAYYGDKGISKIEFIQNDGEQYSLSMAYFSPTSTEKFVQFLNHSA